MRVYIFYSIYIFSCLQQFKVIKGNNSTIKSLGFGSLGVWGAAAPENYSVSRRKKNKKFPINSQFPKFLNFDRANAFSDNVFYTCTFKKWSSSLEIFKKLTVFLGAFSEILPFTVPTSRLDILPTPLRLPYIAALISGRPSLTSTTNYLFLPTSSFTPSF